MFIGFFAFSQNAEILILNSNSATSAASLDIEVRVMPADTVFSRVSAVAYLKSSGIMSVPSNTIVNIILKEAGTSRIFSSSTNQVFSPNEFKILHLFGTSASTRSTTFTGYKQSSSSTTFKYNFRHTTVGLQDIDLIVRETNDKLADDFSYGEGTFTFDDEYAANSYILDITPKSENSNKLFSYSFAADKLGRENIYLFTAGTNTSNDIYMLQMSGVVNKLPRLVSSTVGSLVSKRVTLYPNPAESYVNLPKGFTGNIDVSDVTGTSVLSFKCYSEAILSTSDLQAGVYFIRLSDKNEELFDKILVK